MGNPFASTASWSARHPWWAVLITFVVVAGTGAGMSQVKEGRIQELFVPDDLPALAVQDTIEATWGKTEPAFLLYVADDPTDPQLIRDMADDMDEVRKIDGVEGVQGLPALIESRGAPLRSLSDEEVRAIAVQIRDGPGGQQFIVEDAVLVRVVLAPVDDIPAMTAALDAVRDASDADADVISAGGLYIEQYQSENAGGDVAFLMPLSLMVVLALLGTLFRRVQDVAVPVLTVLLSIVMAYGTVAWVGFALAPPSFIVMPLLLGLGVDYMLHIVYAYREQDARFPVAARFRNAGQNVGYPVFYTAATTLIGFGSFLVSNIPQIRTWGLLIGSGALYAFLLGFFFMPALYRLRRKKPRVMRLPLNDIMAGVSQGVVRHRFIVLLAVGLVTVGLGIAATQVEIKDTVDFDIDEDVQAFIDLEEVQDRFGGQSVVQFLIVDGDREDIAAFEAALAAEPATGFLDGPVSRLQRAGQPDAPLDGPLTKDIVQDDLALVTVGYREEDRDDAIDAFEEVAQDSDLDARITGRDVLGRESESRFLPSIARSTGIALIAVAVLLWLVFRSPVVALLAFSPLVITIIWQLGVQTIVGIPINPITGVMTAMILGVGVDYSLHIMAHFQDARKAGRTSQDAARSALRSVGRPVLAASITTVFAFAVLGFSSLAPLRDFGIVAAIVVTCAFLASMTYLPVVASFLPGPKPKRTRHIEFIERPVVRPRFADPEVAVWFEESRD